MKKAMLALAAATALFCAACERRADTPVVTDPAPVVEPVEPAATPVDTVVTPEATPFADAPADAPDAVIVTEPVATPE